MKKRLGSMVLAAAMLAQGAAALPTTASAAEQYLYGDLSGDGKLTGDDLTLMRRGLRTPGTLDAVQTAIFDLDANGQNTAADVNLLRDYLLTESRNFRRASGIHRRPSCPITGRKRSRPGALSRSSTAAPMRSMRAAACL